jgi:hypothetical protein
MIIQSEAVEDRSAVPVERGQKESKEVRNRIGFLVPDPFPGCDPFPGPKVWAINQVNVE